MAITKYAGGSGTAVGRPGPVILSSYNGGQGSQAAFSVGSVVDGPAAGAASIDSFPHRPVPLGWVPLRRAARVAASIL